MLSGKADWSKTRPEIRLKLQNIDLSEVATPMSLDVAADVLVDAVVEVVHRSVPRDRPSAYVKKC